MLSYTGDASPEVLDRDVAFRAGPAFVGALAVVVGMGALQLLFLAWGAYGVLTGTWIRLGGAWPYAGWAGLAALGFLPLHWRLGGTVLTVGPHGIVVWRRGVVVQSCRWQEMTIRVRGRLAQRQILADRYGRPFPTFLPRGNDPDEPLAISVVRTKTRALASALPQRRLARTALVGAGIALAAVGVLGMVWLPGVSQSALAVFADGASSLTQRAESLAALVGVGLLCSGLLLGPLPAALAVGARSERRAREHRTQLQAFVAERQGRLDAADMGDGRWHRYVAPKELARAEQEFVGGILVAAAFPVLFAIALLFAPRLPSTRDAVAIGLVCVPIMLFGAWMARRGWMLRRGVRCLIRRAGPWFEVRTPDGAVDVCRLVRAPKYSRAASLSFGALRLRVAGCRTYDFDPRYLVPADEP